MMSSQYLRIDERERKEDKPPFSRVFVVCHKQTQLKDLQEVFETYGEIEDLFMPRDRQTGEAKGIAYVKYNMTSSAAAAVQDLRVNLFKINNRPIKVMIASNKSDSSWSNEDQCKRLFIKVNKEDTDDAIYEYFKRFGQIESVHVQKDKITEESKGFAYVQFYRFFDAAKAFEDCERRYKPVFALPKDGLKRSLTENNSGGSRIIKDNYCLDNQNNINLLSNVTPQRFSTVFTTCSPQVPQKYIEKLFNIVPGMVHCQYTNDTPNNTCKASITYDNEKSATHAVDRLNHFEFPSGEVISVQPSYVPINKAANNLNNIVNDLKNTIETGSPNLLQLAEAIAQASSLLKTATNATERNYMEDNFCDVKLPPPQPMVSATSRVAQRCFIVCKPHPPPLATLKDVFCRFGDLIDVCTFPNKTFGFVKYASVKAAEEAIHTLHGATLCGIYIKVLVADEKPSKDDVMAEQGNESKRIRLGT